MDNTEFRSAKTFLDFYGDSEGSCSFSEHFIDELVDKVDNALDSRILLMKEAEANFRASGENKMELTGCWWPVRRALGFVFAAPAFSDVQKSRVASSEPLTNLSQVA